MKSASRKSVTTRLIVFTTTVIVLAVVVTGAAITGFAARTTRLSIRERNMEIARLTDSEIELFLSNALQSFRVYAEHLALIGDSPFRRQVLLENLVMIQRDFVSFMVTDEHGTRIVSSGLTAGVEVLIPPRHAYTRLVNGVDLYDVQLSQDGFPYLVAATAVPGTDEVLTAVLNIRAVWRILDKVRVGRRGFCVLVSAYGRVIGHPDRGLIFSAPDAELTRVLSGTAETGDVVLVETAVRGERMLLAIAEVLPIGWSLVFQQPVQEAYIPARSLIIISLALVFAAIGCASGLSYAFAHRALSPLRRLVDGIEGISGATLDRRVRVDGDDEIGDLAVAFNGMLSRLEERTLELERSELEYRLVTDNASDIIFALDERARVRFINNRFESLASYDKEDVLGRDFTDFLDSESRVRMDEHVRRAIELGHDYRSPDFTVLINPKRGDSRSVEVKLVPHRDEPTGIVLLGVGRDVTERDQLREQMLQAEKLSSLGEIISGVAHELNNPLTSVIGNADLLLLNQDLPQNTVSSLELIRQEAQRTARIVKNLLTFARKYPPERSWCHINEIIRSVVNIRAYEVAVSRIELDLGLSGELPAAFVDPNQLRQVFLNLLNNAIHSLHDKALNRCLRITTRRAEDLIIVSFMDNGRGIADDVKKRIFDPFYTTKGAAEGTGLGLSISLGIVQEHDGTIRVNSRLGEGAEFIVEFPVSYAGSKGDPRQEREEAVVVDPMRVLVVDDEEHIRRILSHALSGQGCRVSGAASGAEAIGLLESLEFDEILCDFRMADVDGFGVYAWIEANKPELSGRFTIITGDVLNNDMQVRMNGAHIPHLKKPFGIRDLMLHLRDRQRQRAAGV